MGLSEELDKTKRPRLGLCAGLHPCHVIEEDLKAMCKFIRLSKDKLVAVGEIGLDYSPHVLKRQVAELAALSSAASAVTDSTANPRTVAGREQNAGNAGGDVD